LTSSRSLSVIAFKACSVAAHRPTARSTTQPDVPPHQSLEIRSRQVADVFADFWYFLGLLPELATCKQV